MYLQGCCNGFEVNFGALHGATGICVDSKLLGNAAFAVCKAETDLKTKKNVCGHVCYIDKLVGTFGCIKLTNDWFWHLDYFAR